MSDITTLMMAAAGGGVEEPDPNFNQTVLLLHGDGTNGAQNNTFLDSGTANGGSGFTITRNGNTTQGTFSPFSAPDGRWSNYFNGTGDYLTTPDSADWDLGSGDFTIESWIYPTTSGVGVAIVSAFNSSDGFSFEITSGNLLTFWAEGSYRVTSTGSISANAWSHVAVSRIGTSLKLFINGVVDGSVTNSTDISGSSSVLAISGTPSGTFLFSGYQSNLSILKGTGIDFSSTGVPTSPLSTSTSNQKLLTCYSNRFVDANTATTAKAITITGAPKVTPFSPFAPTAAYSASVNGGSGYFDGSGDYLSVADNAAFTLGASNFTIEAWVYWTGSETETISGQINSAGNGGLSYLFRTNASDLMTGSVYVSTTAYTATSSVALPKNQWVHVAFVRDGNTTRLYINGVQDGTADVTGVTVNDSAEVLSIGRPGAYNGDYWTGYISNFRQLVGTCLYPNGTTFTPSTSPLTTTSQGATSSEVKLLLNFTNAGIFDNTGKNNLETVGNAQIDTTTKKYGTGSMEFDGTGDYIDIPFSQDFVFGTGDFTVELWVYVNSTGRFPMVMLGKGADASPLAESTWALRTNTTDLIFSRYDDPTSTTFSVTWAAAATTWYHIAVTRSGTDLRFFVDGTQVGSTQTSSTNFSAISTTDPLRIGRFTYSGGTVDQLNGYIDDLRITKGVARYTSNFTAPTKAFADL